MSAAFPPFRHVLMADPAAFAVEEVHNVFMQDEAGALQQIDSAAAQRQWQALHDAYLDRGLEVYALHADGKLPDLCFTANPSLVLPTADGVGEAWLARMCHASRQPEVQAHEDFYRALEIPICTLSPEVERFEGAGDGLLHPDRAILHCGVGQRSCAEAWDHIATARPDLEFLRYELQDSRYYHLDTALVPLDSRHALYVESAFDADGLAQLHAAFPGAAPIDPQEALHFAGNAHCPDGKHVLLQAGCPRTEAWLREHGYKPIALETGEFRKSGGSVFCLKQMF